MSLQVSIQQEVRLLSLAAGFFTRVPMPAVTNFHESDLNHAAKYLPLVGIFIGLTAGFVYWASAMILPIQLAVILSMLASIYLTGCFHEDGLADAVDGLGGGLDKEHALTIMQDSRIGSYGAVALILVLLTKFQALANMSPVMVPAVLIVGHALSRYAAVFVIFTQDYVRTIGKAKPLATKLSLGEMVLASVFGLMPLLALAPKLLWALLPAVLMWLWFSRKLKTRLGGYTGDCLGAVQQLIEVVLYVSILAVSNLGVGTR